MGNYTPEKIPISLCCTTVKIPDVAWSLSLRLRALSLLTHLHTQGGRAQTGKALTLSWGPQGSQRQRDHKASKWQGRDENRESAVPLEIPHCLPIGMRTHMIRNEHTGQKPVLGSGSGWPWGQAGAGGVQFLPQCREAQLHRVPAGLPEPAPLPVCSPVARGRKLLFLRSVSVSEQPRCVFRGEEV